MNKLFFLLLTFAIVVQLHAQDRINSRQLDVLKKGIKDGSLLKDDPDFTAANASTGWATESAVILCQKTQFEFDKKGVSAGKRIGRNILGIFLAPVTLGSSIYWANASNETKILVEETERRKILLRDKFALEQYSVLYFRLAMEGDAFAARVIKRDGSMQEVDMSDAVRVEDARTVPGTFRSYTEARFSSYYRPVYFKLAIPNLEEGDIIEYEFRNFNSQEYSSNPSYKEFSPVYYVCNREMPVVRQIIEVVAQDEKYNIGYKSMKGAPEFSVSSEKGRRVYRWVDDNRDKMDDTRYVNEFVEKPSVKFQVTYARNSGKAFVWFKDENDMHKDLTPEDLSEKVRTFWSNSSKLENTGDYTTGLSTSIDKTVDGIYKELKKKGVTESVEEDYARKAYYYIRSITLYRNWSDYAFAKVFSGLLARKKINHDIIVSTSNMRTDLSKVAFTQEITWAVRLNGKYYCNPYEHLNPEEVPSYMAGNACVRFNYKDASTAAADVIPVSDTAMNVVATQITARLTGGNEHVVIGKTVEAKGLVKDDLIDDVVALTPFMESDYRNYDGSSMWEGMSDKEQAKATEEFMKAKKEWKEDKPKMMKGLAESEYGMKVEKYDNFRLQQDGRNFRKKFIRYSEDFTLSEMVARAGEDLIISLPAMLGQQTRILKEERKRSAPIDMRYPRKLLWHIEMEIPAGYTVKGVENLNKSVDNEAATFVSTAVVADNKLIIDARKIYKAARLQSSQWDELLAMLDMAYNFSQSKAVLKKEN